MRRSAGVRYPIRWSGHCMHDVSNGSIYHLESLGIRFVVGCPCLVSGVLGLTGPLPLWSSGSRVRRIGDTDFSLWSKDGRCDALLTPTITIDSTPLTAYCKFAKFFFSS